MTILALSFRGARALRVIYGVNLWSRQSLKPDKLDCHAPSDSARNDGQRIVASKKI